MKRFSAEPGDTVRMTAKDVEHATTGPVTSGLTGTLTLYDAAGNVVGTPSSITLNSGDDWYVDITAPAAGLYRLAMVLTVGSAQRTLEAELRVI